MTVRAATADLLLTITRVRTAPALGNGVSNSARVPLTCVVGFAVLDLSAECFLISFDWLRIFLSYSINDFLLKSCLQFGHTDFKLIHSIKQTEWKRCPHNSMERTCCP